FQAEDGIRDFHVTGVQTCALPILGLPIEEPTISIPTPLQLNSIAAGDYVTATHYGSYDRLPETYFGINEWMRKNKVIVTGMPIRSEERRVGKEWRGGRRRDECRTR